MESNDANMVEEEANCSIPKGGPIYISNLLSPLTSVPEFQNSLLRQQQELEAELDSTEFTEPEDICVGDLKIIKEEEFVEIALKEAFKENEPVENVSQGVKNDSDSDYRLRSGNKHAGESTSTSIMPSNGCPGTDLDGAVTERKKCSKKQKRRRANNRHIEDKYIKKVEELANIKQWQDEDKATVKLHALNDCSIPSTDKIERLKSLLSTSSCGKAKSADVKEHIPVLYPETVLCVEVYHNIRKWLKVQEFLVLGHQTLTQLKDNICCRPSLFGICHTLSLSGFCSMKGDCKHTVVIRDMRLIHPKDVQQNRAAYPIMIFQLKLRVQKCSVCKLSRATKVTVDDNWARENRCYFCDYCFSVLHCKDESPLYGEFSVYDYVHD